MEQPLPFLFPAMSVSELTRYLRQLLESDEILQDIWVRGEVSNLSRLRACLFHLERSGRFAALCHLADERRTAAF